MPRGFLQALQKLFILEIDQRTVWRNMFVP